MQYSSQKGISLYLAIMILSVLLALALGISSIFLGQVKDLRQMGYSVTSFYAADAGIEQVLLTRAAPTSSCTQTAPCPLGNGADYFLTITPSGGTCTALNYCIKSTGEYQGVRRAIEISY